MYNCVVIFGESHSGKSYIADFIQKKLNVKTFHLDIVISFVTESIRKYFENKKFKGEEKFLYIKGLDVSNKEFDNLLDDLNKMFLKNLEFFENLYVKSIKEIRPSWSFRTGIDKPKDVMNLGRLGNLLNPYGSYIIDLVFKFIIKRTPHFVIEGIYFSKDTNYLKKLETRCKKISYLETFYNQETRSYAYEFNKIKINSLGEIIKKLKNELNFGN